MFSGNLGELLQQPDLPTQRAKGPTEETGGKFK